MSVRDLDALLPATEEIDSLRVEKIGGGSVFLTRMQEDVEGACIEVDQAQLPELVRLLTACIGD